MGKAAWTAITVTSMSMATMSWATPIEKISWNWFHGKFLTIFIERSKSFLAFFLFYVKSISYTVYDNNITQNVNENMNTHNGHDGNDEIPGNSGS